MGTINIHNDQCIRPKRSGHLLFYIE
ncbi:MAG: hypothetical protein QOJ54_2708, partial [Aliidongia sp.]|nr:hypothetical protein [Aliidongia sp.]